MKTFEVSTDNGSLTIVPLNVTFVREISVRIEQHDPRCVSGDTACPLLRPPLSATQTVTSVLTGGYSCTASGEQRTEICFVNTIGPQSSVHAHETKQEVRNLLDEALRYDR